MGRSSTQCGLRAGTRPEPWKYHLHALENRPRSWSRTLWICPCIAFEAWVIFQQMCEPIAVSAVPDNPPPGIIMQSVGGRWTFDRISKRHRSHCVYRPCNVHPVINSPHNRYLPTNARTNATPCILLYSRPRTVSINQSHASDQRSGESSRHRRPRESGLREPHGASAVCVSCVWLPYLLVCHRSV